MNYPEINPKMLNNQEHREAAQLEMRAFVMQRLAKIDQKHADNYNHILTVIMDDLAQRGIFATVMAELPAINKDGDDDGNGDKKGFYNFNNMEKFVNWETGKPDFSSLVDITKRNLLMIKNFVDWFASMTVGGSEKSLEKTMSSMYYQYLAALHLVKTGELSPSILEIIHKKSE